MPIVCLYRAGTDSFESPGAAVFRHVRIERVCACGSDRSRRRTTWVRK